MNKILFIDHQNRRKIKVKITYKNLMNRGNSGQFYYSLRFHDKANCNDTFKTCKKQKIIFLCRDIIKISVGISCRNSVNSSR